MPIVRLDACQDCNSARPVVMRYLGRLLPQDCPAWADTVAGVGSSAGLCGGLAEPRAPRVAETLRAIEPARTNVSGIRLALGTISAMLAASISASPAAISASSRPRCL